MLQKFLILTLFFSPLIAFAQKNADMGNTTFEKSEKSVVSYSGFGLEYYRPTDLYEGFGASSSNGFGASVEFFNPLGKKTAITLNTAFKFMTITYDGGNKYDQTSTELNLGLHQLLIKGFYIKPQLGLASINGNYTFNGVKSKLDSELKGTYAVQSGYMFKLGGERSKFLDFGLIYQSYFSGGDYVGVGLKFLKGPKK